MAAAGSSVKSEKFANVTLEHCNRLTETITLMNRVHDGSEIHFQHLSNTWEWAASGPLPCIGLVANLKWVDSEKWRFMTLINRRTSAWMHYTSEM